MQNSATINSTVTQGGTINSTVTVGSTIQSTLTGGGIGPQGETGATGTPGTMWHQAAGAPTTLYANGDFYLNTTTGDIYVQSGNSWGSPVGNIKGPAGTNNITNTTPTNLSGILKGNGSTISVALGDTDYQNPITLTTTGTSGAATLIGDVLNIPQYSGGTSYTAGTGLTLTGTVFSLTSPVTVAQGGTGATTLTGLVKGNGTSAFTAAVSGTDYAPATSGSSILYGNGSGGFSNVTVGTGLSFSGGTLSATGGGGAVSSVANSDGTLTISPTTGSVVASLALGHANTWTGAQTFNAGKLLDKGEIVFDVKAFGAVGNNSTDDTSAIQAAIDAANTAGGGTVWFPVGTYKISSPLKLYSGSTPTITAYQNIVLAGAGSSNTGGTIINQVTTGDDVILGINDAANGAQVMNITMQNFCLQFNGGVLTNSGNGVYLKAQAANSPAFYHFHFENVKVANCQGSGKYGFNFESIIVSDMVDCEAVVCANGFLFNGAANATQWSSVNTSITLTSCYSNSSIGYGYRIIDTTYMTLNACACDVSNNNVSTSAYSIEAGNAIALVGCGFEGDGTHTLANGFHIAADSFSTGSEQISMMSCYGFQSKSTIEVYVTGVSTGVNIFGYQSNSSISGSTGLKVDAGSSVFEAGCAWDTGVATVRTLAAGSFDTIMGDSDAWGVFTMPGSTSGQTVLKPSAVASGTLTLPAATDTLVARTTTDTLTNKRVTKRSGTTAGPGATPSLNTDNYDIYTFTALAAAITSMTTNLTGTPVTGDKLLLGFKDNGTARAITWGASFVSSGVATLLATTVINKQHWVELMYDGSHWVCLAVDATGY